MKTTTIITAKIKPYIYDMIVHGQKQFEVRNESFCDAAFIRYVEPESGREFPDPVCPCTRRSSIYRLGPEYDFDRSSDGFVQALSGLSEAAFAEMFPNPGHFFAAYTGSINTLYAAPIGARISTLPQIFEEEQ
ncbi:MULTISPECIES: hypothetical protein [Bifidobacterium]|uniref:ASCH domain-containing protein n=1 Tax=Bifidobacterium tibiigranuli TaxID=2172043 RepID=A0A5N6S9P8_9BIFI|nr:hypothetical protein [Bifidobacterium tibiigranuli]KAE8130231.1 hypothetical protein DDE84_01235 [Bifidobacterium tibiigranuli]KAE8130410.1 hypothetical protein DDF78_00420 [Bifidobacterium tibiigranuli]